MSLDHKTCPYIAGGVICKKFKKNKNCFKNCEKYKNYIDYRKNWGIFA